MHFGVCTNSDFISIHAPREGCDTAIQACPFQALYFNPRTPRGVRHAPANVLNTLLDFNPRTPRGVRHGPWHWWPEQPQFQSTHPARGATRIFGLLDKMPIISIHAPREGCDPSARSPTHQRSISIHAPREGCDAQTHGYRPCRSGISIHAPREGCDRSPATIRRGYLGFQSTHPARGATASAPRASQSGRISIHAPREGCDPGAPGKVVTLLGFQSTHPARGATARIRSSSSVLSYFNPRTPRGVRLLRLLSLRAPQYFNPRTPRGVRLSEVSASARSADFNPRTPRGVRRSADLDIAHEANFNPRTPRGVRPLFTYRGQPREQISIHAPREGCDSAKLFSDNATAISIHAPREGCDLFHLPV